MQRLNIGIEAAEQKIKHFCSYQERGHAEVREKLYDFGLRTNEVEELIGKLIAENYLNETRFAQQYAGGKFRIKQWGKIKIAYQLKSKQVSPYNIKKALAQIDEMEYWQTFNKLAQAKWHSLRGEKNIFTKKSKLRSFMLQRGFESELVYAFFENNL